MSQHRYNWIMSLLLACGSEEGMESESEAESESESEAESEAESESESEGEIIQIPDPGTGKADWGYDTLPNDTEYHDTPQTAYPVGVVIGNTDYVQGFASPKSGDFFYVFRAGPKLTQFRFSGGPANMEYLHLHEGDGLVFGAEVEALESTPSSGKWDVTPDSIYVVELHSTDGGFF